MAYSKSFFGLRRGSTKSQTYSVLRGQQITKDRVYEVANPRSTSQMTQRALFATAVKFYKHANQNFFKFAFEDRRQTESEYNAFMRHNLQYSTIYNYPTSKMDFFPAIGRTWMLTNGSMPTPEVTVPDATVTLDVPSIVGTETTYGEISAAIIKDYGLLNGDIVTIVGVLSYATSIYAEPGLAPAWDIRQFILDTDSTEEFSTDGQIIAGSVKFFCGMANEVACAGAIIFSRNVKDSGVKVSTSMLVNNARANSIYNASLSDAYRDAALQSWGATGQAILQGSIAKKFEPLPEVITVSANPVTLELGSGAVSSDFLTAISDDPEVFGGAKISTSHGDFYGNPITTPGARGVFFGGVEATIAFAIDDTEQITAGSIAFVNFTDYSSITLNSLTLAGGREFTFQVGN